MIEDRITLMIDKHLSSSMIVNAIKEDIVREPCKLFNAMQQYIELMQSEIADSSNGEYNMTLHNKFAQLANDLFEVQQMHIAKACLNAEQLERFEHALKQLMQFESTWYDKVCQAVIDVTENMIAILTDEQDVVKYDASLYQSALYQIDCILELIDKDRHQASVDCLKKLKDIVAPLCKPYLNLTANQAVKHVSLNNTKL